MHLSLKKHSFLRQFSIWNLISKLINILVLICKFVKLINLSLTPNLQYLFLLLLLLILDNDIHQIPGPNTNELSVFHLNSRSVRNKLEYIENIASEFFIICITESHLDQAISDLDIKLDGFSENIFRKDRNCFGGGVLVYSSQGICVKRRSDIGFES